MQALVDVLDFEDADLQLFDHLLLRVRSLLGQLGNRLDLPCLFLVVSVEFGIVLGELTESLARGCLDLERLELFQDVCSVHPLDDGIDVADQLFFEDFSALGEDVLFAGAVSVRVLDGTQRDHLVAGPTRHVVLREGHTRQVQGRATHAPRALVTQAHSQGEGRAPGAAIDTSAAHEVLEHSGRVGVH